VTQDSEFRVSWFRLVCGPANRSRDGFAAKELVDYWFLGDAIQLHVGKASCKARGGRAGRGTPLQKRPLPLLGLNYVGGTLTASTSGWPYRPSPPGPAVLPRPSASSTTPPLLSFRPPLSSLVLFPWYCAGGTFRSSSTSRLVLGKVPCPNIGRLLHPLNRYVTRWLVPASCIISHSHNQPSGYAGFDSDADATMGTGTSASPVPGLPHAA